MSRFSMLGALFLGLLFSTGRLLHAQETERNASPADSFVVSVLNSMTEEIYKNKKSEEVASPAEKFVVKGSLYALFENYPLAKLELEKAIKLDPLYGFAHFNLASVCALQADAKCSAVALDRACFLDPRYKRAAQLSADFQRVRSSPELTAVFNKKYHPGKEKNLPDNGDHILQLSAIRQLVAKGLKVEPLKITGSLDDVRRMSLEYVKSLDLSRKVAPPENSYSKRLDRITSQINDDGLYNFKVYLNPDANALSFADGSIRINSGLMDLFTDSELLAVVGHEIGHIALKHRAKQFMGAQVGGALTEPLLGELMSYTIKLDSEAKPVERDSIESGALVVMEGALSQELEKEADRYSVDFLKTFGKSPQSAVSALRKLAKYEAGLIRRTEGEPTKSLNIATHQDTSKRADQLEELLKKN